MGRWTRLMTVAAAAALLGACAQDAADTLVSPVVAPRFDGHTPGGNVVPPDTTQTANSTGTATSPEPVEADSLSLGHTPGGN